MGLLALGLLGASVPLILMSWTSDCLSLPLVLVPGRDSLVPFSRPFPGQLYLLWLGEAADVFFPLPRCDLGYCLGICLGRLRDCSSEAFFAKGLGLSASRHMDQQPSCTQS